MATITRLYGWDCGNSMVPDSDVDTVGYVSASTSQKKTGSYALALYGLNGNRFARFPISGSPSNPSVSLWVLCGSTTVYDQSKIWLRFLVETGHYIDLRWNSTTHTFDAYIDDTIAKAGTVSVGTNTWFHVQFYAVIDDAPNGAIYVKIDGRESIAETGLDTMPGATGGVTHFYVMLTNTPNTAYFDDLAIGYGGFLGDIRCIDIRPSADTAQDDWTPSAGDNYSTIDETPPSDADYNETNVDAQADELALGDFDGVTYNPVAVTAWVRAQMLAATGDSIKVGIDSGGTDDVTEHALSTTWQYYFHTADLNPADAAEWEDADIDALLLRYESVIA